MGLFVYLACLKLQQKWKHGVNTEFISMQFSKKLMAMLTELNMYTDMHHFLWDFGN